MSDQLENNPEKYSNAQSKSSQESVDNPCPDIKDPVRKALFSVCQPPVIGEVPFCKGHEPPVP